MPSPPTSPPRPTVDSVVAHADIAWVVVGREVVVHRPGPMAAHVLDPMASVLWRCLDGESPLGEVFADIADAVGEPVEVVTRDCLPVIDSWLRAGIASDARSSAPSPPPALRTWRRLVDPPNA